MSKTGTCIIAAFFLFTIPHAASAEKPSEESVRKLMDSSGASSIGQEILDQIIPELRRFMPEAPDSFWEDVRKEIDTEGLLKKIIPVYQENLSAKDVDAIAAFYRTEAGANMVKAQVVIMGESYRLGEEWGKEVVQDVLRMLRARGEGDAGESEKPATE